MLDQGARLRPVALEEVERARGAVGQTDGERMLRRLGEPDRLGLVLGRLGELPSWARLMTSQARSRPMAVRRPEILVDPVGGQRREVVGGQLDHPLVLAPVVMRLLEIARG